MHLFDSSQSRRRLLGLALATVGCSGSDPGVKIVRPGIVTGSVAVIPTSDGLAVNNQTERPTFLIAMERETSALVDWVPCTGGSGCPSLEQGEVRMIPWSSVNGASPSKPEYVVYWWHAETASDGSSKAGSIQNLVVRR